MRSLSVSKSALPLVAASSHAPFVDAAPLVRAAGASPACQSATQVGLPESAEVVVVGTGAGGAVAGTALAAAGHRVLFLEAGGAFHQPHFQQRSLPWAMTHLWGWRGMQTADGNARTVVASGQVVGGST